MRASCQRITGGSLSAIYHVGVEGLGGELALIWRDEQVRR